MNNSIIIFDLDGTLIDSNSTFDFLYFFMGNKFKYKIFNCFFAKILNRISVKLFRLDFKRNLNLLLLKGFSRTQLEVMAQDFYDKFISSNRIKSNIVELLNTFISEGREVYIATATLDFLGEVIMKQLCPKISRNSIFTTEMNYNADVCTGTLRIDLLNRKKQELEKHGIYGEYLAVVSDDIYDAKLMENSENNFVVITKKNRLRWKNYLENNQLKNIKLLGEL